MELKLAVLALMVATTVTARHTDGGTQFGQQGSDRTSGFQIGNGNRGDGNRGGGDGGNRGQQILELCTALDENDAADGVTLCENIAIPSIIQEACDAATAAGLPATDLCTDNNASPSSPLDRIEDGLERLQTRLEDFCGETTKRQGTPPAVCDDIEAAIDAVETLMSDFEAACEEDPIDENIEPVCTALGLPEDEEEATKKRATRKMVENLLRKLLARKK